MSNQGIYDHCPRWLRITATFHQSEKPTGHEDQSKNSVYIPKTKSKPCKLTRDGFEHKFCSMSRAARFLHVTLNIFSKAKKNGKEIDGYKIS